MALSPTVYARQTILAALKGTEEVKARIPAGRIYPAKTPNAPVKPFGRYGTATSEPDRYSCWRGGDVSGAYHVFAGVADDIPDPEAWVGETVDIIAEAIDAIDDCYTVRTQVLQDPEEADLWHGIVFFEMKALAPA
jgi:hypothetical protein